MQADFSTHYSIVIVGGGASGCMAAMSALSMHCDPSEIVILEADEAICKKIYVTGNGRCNLTNLYQDDSCFYSDTDARPYLFLNDFGEKEICSFFTSNGVLLHDRNGYVYPRTDQASVIPTFFEKQLRRHGVTVMTGACVTKVCALPSENTNKNNDAAHIFQITWKNSRSKQMQNITADAVVIATGGLAAPQFHAKGDGYRFAASFGHHIIPPVPALTYLTTDDRQTKVIAGVRAFAKISLLYNQQLIRSERGEIQFTERGISGIPTFQISRLAARLMETSQDKKLSPAIEIDFLPELGDEEWATEKDRRLSDLDDRDLILSDLFIGLVNTKIASWLIRREGLVEEKKIYKIENRKQIADHLLSLLRNTKLTINGTGDFKSAQTTAGGIDLQEINKNTMESGIQRGLYFAGEVMDVDGICGGYNLTFAFSSGFQAGRAAANYVRTKE